MSFSNIIEIDEYKEKIKGYSPKLAFNFHSQSARLANKDFEKKIKTREHDNLILLCGGSASGKSEITESLLAKEPKTIIFDSTLSTFEGAKIKIKLGQKYCKSVEVVAVLPENIRFAFSAFLGRDRNFPERYFFQTHIGARKTMLEIFERYEDVGFRIFESSISDKDELAYSILRFDSRDRLGEYLQKIQLETEDLYDKIRNSNAD